MADKDRDWTNKEWDSTLLLIGLMFLFFVVLLGLFLADFVFLRNSEKRLLTEALVHTILGFIGGWLSSIVTFFFGMKMNREQLTNSTKMENQK